MWFGLSYDLEVIESDCQVGRRYLQGHRQPASAMRCSVARSGVVGHGGEQVVRAGREGCHGHWHLAAPVQVPTQKHGSLLHTSRSAARRPPRSPRAGITAAAARYICSLAVLSCVTRVGVTVTTTRGEFTP